VWELKAAVAQRGVYELVPRGVGRLVVDSRRQHLERRGDRPTKRQHDSLVIPHARSDTTERVDL
jgi:hypothetical protein